MKIKYYESHFSGHIFVREIDSEQTTKPEDQRYTEDIRYIHHTDDILTVSVCGYDYDGYHSEDEDKRNIVTFHRNLDNLKKDLIQKLEDRKSQIDKTIKEIIDYKDPFIKL